MSAPWIYVALGLALFLAVILPPVLDRWRVNAPMVLVTLGLIVGLLPGFRDLDLDPVAHGAAITHITEFTVLVSLMGVGLALDRPLSFRDWGSWRSWSPTWRLLGIAMPLTIAGVALLAWGPFGVAAPAALLLGAALAPTDPVLASDVQVGGPNAADTADGEEEQVDEEDEVRFALTSEAGLNDGLAFPFVHAAILLATVGAFSQWGAHWVAWEGIGKIALGVAVGVAIGWAVTRLAFTARSEDLRFAATGEPLVAIAALLATYGAAEVVGGYGFLAVFTCAMAIRSFERAHSYHHDMHEVIERLERLLTLVVLLFLGMALTNGLLANLDWQGVTLSLALLLVIRPLAGMASFIGHRRQRGVQGFDKRERVVAAFFGVRGIGSLFYLAYAATHADFPEVRWLWSVVAFTVVVSVYLHGFTAPWAMAWQERGEQARRRADART
ncbi:sodium:proton antiporter [Janibacter sp. HTCC2649]|uniref:cation:proton antiporter n=1 Tax=Janibacter sp. HTCC2649 TaxID=313589 RepID=UPI000322D6EF|nr:cation:proton antiporter [Janibacter sp. HTCC2649]